MKFFQDQRRWLVILGLLVLLAVIFGLTQIRRGSTRESFRETKVERGNLKLTILSTGTVQPENRLAIKPPVSGRIDSVLVKEGDKVRKGQILAWMSSTERAALLDAARSKGRDEVKRWEELYRPTPVVAPISGTLIARNVEDGQSFTSSDAILVMSDRLTVKAQVDETDISQIQLNQRAEILLDAYPNEKIPATVDQVAFEARTVNNVTTYIVDVLPNETPSFMRSGMTANVTFLVGAKENVLLVPNDALKYQDRTVSVLTRNAEGKNVPKPIQIGLSDGKRTEVVSGLSEGETVLSAQVNLGAPRGTGANPFSPMGSGRRRGGPGG